MRPRRRWEDNIRMDLKEMRINTRNWIHSTQSWDYWRCLMNARLNNRLQYVMVLDPTRRRSLGKPRWEDSVRIKPNEIYVNMRNWINSTQNRDYWRSFVDVALNLRVP